MLVLVVFFLKMQSVKYQAIAYEVSGQELLISFDLKVVPFVSGVVIDNLTDEVRLESPFTMMFADYIVICGESREQVEKSLERSNYLTYIFYIVKSTKFLGVHLVENFSWSLNTSYITKNDQQHLYFLRSKRKSHLPPPILTMFYRGTIKSFLSSCITACFGNCTISDRQTLQRIVRTAEKIIRVFLPPLLWTFTPHATSATPTALWTTLTHPHTPLTQTPTHPSHTLFTLVPSGKQFRSIRASHPDYATVFFSGSSTQRT
ncbi:gastrula zinc finger protein XlCGF28.1-like [Silurus meridionalis]|nr:gastrula zinc finger protein XlCGF28.1-like [Silurus meridionalis]